MLTYHAAGHGIFRQMAEKSTFDEAVACIEEAIGHGADDPYSYARKIFTSRQFKKHEAEKAVTSKRVLKPRTYNV